MLHIEADIQEKTRFNMDREQRDYYLREQLKVIQNELDGESDSDIDEYMAKIERAKDLPKEVREKLINNFVIAVAEVGIFECLGKCFGDSSELT